MRRFTSNHLERKFDNVTKKTLQVSSKEDGQDIHEGINYSSLYSKLPQWYTYNIYLIEFTVGDIKDKNVHIIPMHYSSMSLQNMIA